MTQDAWDKFVKARARFKQSVEETSLSAPFLKNLQQELVDGRQSDGQSNAAGYTVDTPVVYNRSLDDVSPNDEIRLILVGDNPGRREQALENRRYLVGPSGKIAQKFFAGQPALGIDFYKNVIILNKTPIHTPRTVQLRDLCRTKTHGAELAKILEESQRAMAHLLLEFHNCFCDSDDETIPVWIIGYSEMKKNGVFHSYTETLKELYTAAGRKKMHDRLFLFRHFSMNQFTIDLKQQALPSEPPSESLLRIGAVYRQRILGS
ncbi:MAG: uracil-DNA glycosylase family protein [Spirochaetes bacterium]|nr:uracil-DNA glycosylase family protein [Spirochaetota bacterium]